MEKAASAVCEDRSALGKFSSLFVCYIADSRAIFRTSTSIEAMLSKAAGIATGSVVGGAKEVVVLVRYAAASSRQAKLHWQIQRYSRWLLGQAFKL